MFFTFFLFCVLITRCISLAKQCQSGNIKDIRSDNNNIIDWEVCQVRGNQAWVQHGKNYGAYNMSFICESLGYESVTYKRNTNGYRCGNIAGYSCNNPLNWTIFFPEGQWEYNTTTNDITSTKSASAESREDSLKDDSYNCCHVAWVCESQSEIIPIQNITKKQPSKMDTKWVNFNALIIIITVSLWICSIILMIYIRMIYKRVKQDTADNVVIQIKNVRSNSRPQMVIHDVLPPKSNVINIEPRPDDIREKSHSHNTNSNDEGMQIIYAADKILNTKTKPVF